jgi:hypothetical protein
MSLVMRLTMAPVRFRSKNPSESRWRCRNRRMRRSARARSPTQPVKYVCPPESAKAAKPETTKMATTTVSVARSPSPMPSSTATFKRYGGKRATSV